ncbi:Cdc6/Cdc18 family protein [Halobellus rubicundus]|uniref:Cdc6/Cdc18 family protein n=1 Tax=Halobellus rubicundus TaxID=2996466 RepID=A0ABD5M9R0_9EURY
MSQRLLVVNKGELLFKAVTRVVPVIPVVFWFVYGSASETRSQPSLLKLKLGKTESLREVSKPDVFESNSEGNIFRSEKYLDSGHQPEKPVGRETEIQRIAQAIKPVRHGKTPENLLVHGPAGIGKSTTVKHVFDKFEDETSGKAVFINSWKYNTRPSLLTELLIQFGYPAPRKGKPIDELLSKIKEWLDKNRGVAVAIDEFDQLEDPTEVIYDLSMVNQESQNSLGLVMVSNQPPQQVQLDPRSRSRLNCQTLQFQPYNASQLQEILEKRAEKAFQPGAVPDEVIEAIAQQVAENSGDCRTALKTLHKAGRKAEQEGETKISIENLKMT